MTSSRSSVVLLSSGVDSWLQFFVMVHASWFLLFGSSIVTISVRSSQPVDARSCWSFCCVLVYFRLFLFAGFLCFLVFLSLKTLRLNNASSLLHCNPSTSMAPYMQTYADITRLALRAPGVEVVRLRTPSRPMRPVLRPVEFAVLMQYFRSR